MKKLTFFLAFAVLGTQASFATPVATAPVTSVFEGLQQGNPATPKERAERLTKVMATHMNLTADQSAKVQDLNEKRFTEMQEMRQKMMAGGDRTGMREQSMALQKKYDDLLKAAVTSEQYALYEANLDKIREEGGMRGGRGGQGGQQGGNRPQGGSNL